MSHDRELAALKRLRELESKDVTMDLIASLDESRSFGRKEVPAWARDKAKEEKESLAFDVEQVMAGERDYFVRKNDQERTSDLSEDNEGDDEWT